MTRLDTNPRVMKLARDLGLPWRKEPMNQIRNHALGVVAECLERFPATSTLVGLRSALAEQLSVCLEVVWEDADIERVARDYGLSNAERRRLRQEFDHDEVEGWLISNPSWRPGRRMYVAIVDARGVRESRAYFTGWHEISHLIVTPPQLSFEGEGFRRSIPVDKTKDPVESTVDAVAGDLAFYAPFVVPVLQTELANTGQLTFEVIERMRDHVVPEASFYSAAIAAARLAPTPVLLVHVRRAYKKAERRELASGQTDLGLALPKTDVRPKLRVVDVIPGGPGSDLAIFKNMRVPEQSILTHVHEAHGEVTLQADENQSWWETTSDGFLPALPLSVQATRRGGHVYGLISPI